MIGLVTQQEADAMVEALGGLPDGLVIMQPLPRETSPKNLHRELEAYRAIHETNMCNNSVTALHRILTI